MAYDETLATRLRETLSTVESTVEQSMLGGLAFLVQGHLCCGVLNDDLIVRIGDANQKTVLARPHVQPLEFMGAAMPGAVLIDPLGYASPEEFRSWVDMALEYARSLPPK